MSRMKPRERILIALDVEDIDEARQLISTLSPYVGGFKVGHWLIGRYGIERLVSYLSHAKIFLDAKFFDIPNTVAAAVRAAVKSGVWMINLHALGGREMMQRAVAAAKAAASEIGTEPPVIIAVTMLTSFAESDLKNIGIENTSVLEEVLKLARLAKEAGLDGVVASPHEIKAIKKECGQDFKVVTPGICPVWASSPDQKRISTPAEALQLGADYIVIGRAVVNPPKKIGGPVNAIQKILEEIGDG